MLALDTDVLVAWAMTGAKHHREVRVLVEGELAKRRGRIVLTRRVLEEFVHVVSDGRRFDQPFSIAEAIAYARGLLDARDVVCAHPTRQVASRTFELMAELGLGRKRILDTSLAATLEACGVRRLASFNAADFACFPFLELVDPIGR